MRVNICDVQIDPYSFDQVVEKIVDHALNRRSPEYVVTPNAHHVVLLQKDRYFQQVYQEAFLVVPDGVPLLWAAKLLQTPLQGRVNGTDLFERLAAVSAEKNLKIFLLGGRPGAAEQAAKILIERHPTLQVVGTYAPPYGFEQDSAELEKIDTLLHDAAPHLLFVGLGAPKQEFWIHQHYQSIEVPVSLGIGVSFELVSGVVQRAPLWMQRLGLEWFFRLLAEPRRLWQRYLIGNAQFVSLVLRQKFLTGGTVKNHGLSSE